MAVRPTIFVHCPAEALSGHGFNASPVHPTGPPSEHWQLLCLKLLERCEGKVLMHPPCVRPIGPPS